MGQIYIEVDAKAVNNGIMTLETSGGGAEETGYWLYWNGNGFTGTDWYFTDPNCPLSETWPAYLEKNDGKCEQGVKHSADAQGLTEHVNAGHADDLNEMLGAWDFFKKSAFVGQYGANLEDRGCLDRITA